MKIDQILIHYLLKNKELPLQGIGVFKLEGSVSEPSDPSKPIIIPSDAIRFEYNSRTQEDLNLVSFIAENTGKIKPLASADLDSYLTLGRQFLNIGKPLILPNIGTIEKTGSGELIFKGGEYAMERFTFEKNTSDIEEAEPSENESFPDFASKEKKQGKNWIYLFLIIILGLIAWAVWKYSFHKDEPETVIQVDTNSAPEPTPALASPQTKDTTNHSDSLNAPTVQDTSTGFKVVVGSYHSEAAAEKRLNDLKAGNRNVSILKVDSLNYLMTEQFNLPLSDTSKVISSLRIFYGPNRSFQVIRK